MAKKQTKKPPVKKMTVVWLVLMALFITELFAYTWSRVQCFTIGYEISSATSRQRNLLALQSNLRIELARLKSPERISRIARKQLGLITPTPEQTIVVP